MPRNAPQRHTRREIARHGAWRRPPHGAAPPIEGGAVHRQKINGRAPRPDSTARSWSNVVQLEHRATAPRLHTGSARSWATRHAPSRVLMMVERNVCHRSKARLGISNQPIVRRSCEFPDRGLGFASAQQSKKSAAGRTSRSCGWAAPRRPFWLRDDY